MPPPIPTPALNHKRGTAPRSIFLQEDTKVGESSQIERGDLRLMTGVSFTPSGSHIPLERNHFIDFPDIHNGWIRESNASPKDQPSTTTISPSRVGRARVTPVLSGPVQLPAALCGWSPAYWNCFYPALPAQGQPLEHPGSLPGPPRNPRPLPQRHHHHHCCFENAITANNSRLPRLSLAIHTWS